MKHGLIVLQIAKVDNYLVRAISGVVDLDYYLKKS
jgi:hypothetical protein